ncbi:MAG TPA: hypothetical protein VHW71_03335 [Steroidobacteraceae bacterium]|nr:hypothetical protein [Steroidobacteraceae bacterium]
MNKVAAEGMGAAMQASPLLDAVSGVETGGETVTGGGAGAGAGAGAGVGAGTGAVLAMAGACAESLEELLDPQPLSAEMNNTIVS